jgi:hypothetical protein
MEVDGLTTSKRIQLFKNFNSEQYIAFSNVMLNKKNLEELVEFTYKQWADFRVFREQTDRGDYDK